MTYFIDNQGKQQKEQWQPKIYWYENEPNSDTQWGRLKKNSAVQ